MWSYVNDPEVVSYYTMYMINIPMYTRWKYMDTIKDFDYFFSDVYNSSERDYKEKANLLIRCIGAIKDNLNNKIFVANRYKISYFNYIYDVISEPDFFDRNNGMYEYQAFILKQIANNLRLHRYEMKNGNQFFEKLNECYKFIIKNKKYPIRYSNDEVEKKLYNFIRHRLESYGNYKNEKQEKNKNYWMGFLPHWNWIDPVKNYKINIQFDDLKKWCVSNGRNPKRTGEAEEKRVYKIYDKLKRLKLI